MNHTRPAQMMQHYRQDFPIFTHQPDMLFLDSAASAQKPASVIEAMKQATCQHYANVHRGQYQLSIAATDLYEKARADVQKFINAKSPQEIIFTRNATESFNLLSHTLPKSLLGAQDHIAITSLEHHSNFVPWVELCQQKQMNLHVIAPDAQGNITLASIEDCLKTYPIKLLSLTHISNVCGVILPIKEIAKLAHQYGALLLVDGSQAAPHLKIDMQDLEVDFYIFTGHKLYGPTGIAVLYGKYELLEQLPPFMSGGGMVDKVSADAVSFLPPPMRFEAGTPPITEAVGLSAAIDYINIIGIDALADYEHQLASHAHQLLSDKTYLQWAGNPDQQASLFSFNLRKKDGELISAHDVATLLDEQQIAVRAGHHCAQPLMQHFNISACVRASFGIYNQPDDAQRLADALDKTAKMLRLL